MAILPWRVKKFLAMHFPLAYHLVVHYWRQPNSERSWDDVLEQDWHSTGREWPTKNALIKSLARTDDRILDVACGTGGILRYLKANGYENIWGLEQSDYAVARLRKEGVAMIHGQLPHIDAADGSFDIVIASQVLEHVIRRHTFMSEIRRVLSPSGRALIFVPNNCLSPLDEPSHVAVYRKKTLARFVRKYFGQVDVVAMQDANFNMEILFADARK